MSVPSVIPVKCEPDYRTSTIGHCLGGQFFGSVTAAFPEGWSGKDWPENKRWFAVLHRFDEAGQHLGSRIRCTGTTADGERQVIDVACELLDQWLDELPDRTYGDIAIAPFAVHEEGCLFGLVVEQHGAGDSEGEAEGEDDWAELYPDGLGFHAPWDGEYDT
ncbi:hypothetical protein [Kitasatospora sp. NPDC088351]|uniref:hypothetical protein n=1 Tax=Kitasatospora sp. NPDC088351 TaxID=3155180 RepID=UPI00342A23E8